MVASALIPLGLASAVAYLVYSQRQPPKSTCPILTPEERRVVDYTLQTSDRDLLLTAASHGVGQPAAVQEVNALATATEVRGCPEDARKLRAKAGSISRHPPAAQSPWPVPAATTPLFQLPPAGGFVPEMVMVPGPPMAPPMSPPPMGDMGMGPPMSGPPMGGMSGPPMGGMGGPPMGGMSGPPMGGMSGPPMGGMSGMEMGMGMGPPPAATPGTTLPAETAARCWIRPEPRAFDDAQGRFGFSCPAAYPLTLLALGPPSLPPGWAHVELSHPDHGPVQGFVEIANLSALTAAKPSAAAKMPPTQGVASPPNGGKKNGGVIKTADGKTIVMPTLASALAGMSAFQGRKRRRPQTARAGGNKS